MQTFRIAARRAHGITPTTSLINSRYFNNGAALRVRESGTSSEEFEKTKNEQIKKQQQGKGEWHDTLASSSESHVKADQEKVDDHDAHIEELQKETAKAAEKEKK